MPSKPRPPLEIEKSIDEKASQVREAASELNKRIEFFEEYLSRLRGKVEAFTYIAHPERDDPMDNLELGLKFHREGKAWQISYGDYKPLYHDEHPIDWKPLREAPLKLKIAGVMMFPDLLQAIERSQLQLVAKITEAIKEFDDFAASLKEEKGGAK